MENLQTQSDSAISKFESSLNDRKTLRDENLNFTHWDDIINKILDVWYNKYESHLKLCNKESEFTNLILKFKTEIVKIFSKKSDFQTYKTYYHYIIDFQIEQIKNEMTNFDFEQKENNDMMIDKLRNLKLNRQPQVKLAIKEDIQTNNLFKSLMFNLTHMMRCHSKQNDPNDNSSQVTNAAFEISTLSGSYDQFSLFTNIVATCGQNIINLIDVETGKVWQRFNDDIYLNQSKEVYNCLAWTVIDNVSILAGAGKHGQIKLIIPKHSVCLSRIDAHKTEIYSLLFHPKFPNILLSASDDHQIKIWKLNLKESNCSTECELTFENLAVIEYSSDKSNTRERVYSMCFASNEVLIISTEVSNYGIYLTDNKLFDKFIESYDQDMNGMTTEDLTNYMTSKPQDKNKVIKANELRILSYTSNNSSFEDTFIANKVHFLNNLLVACIANSEIIYVIKLDLDTNLLNDNIFRAHVISHIKLADNKNEINLMPSFFKNTDLDKYALLRPTSNGLFEYVVLNSETTNLYTALRYKIPAEYTIKNQKDLTKIPVDNYNLLEKSKVLASVTNGEYIVSTTNQNVITIWSKNKI